MQLLNGFGEAPKWARRAAAAMASLAAAGWWAADSAENDDGRSYYAIDISASGQDALYGTEPA